MIEPARSASAGLYYCQVKIVAVSILILFVLCQSAGFSQSGQVSDTPPNNPQMLKGSAESDAVSVPGTPTEAVPQSQSAQTQNPQTQYPQQPLQGSVYSGQALAPQMIPSNNQPAPTFSRQWPTYPLNASAASGPAYAPTTAVDSRGTPVLPRWKTQPDEIISHFRLEYFGIPIKSVNKPVASRIHFIHDQQWRGNRHAPCFIWLTPLTDGSSGYYFQCMESPYGPRGWLYPIPKRGPEDKVTPWAIFFNQP